MRNGFCRSWMVYSAIGCVLAGCALGVHAEDAPPVRTVPSVDLARYAGTWYEIARLPNVFQRMCADNVTATYVRQPDATVLVTNRCRRSDGVIEQVSGIARPAAPDTSGARLEVSFLPAWLRWLPVGWGDYWVVWLDEAYTLAVVSDRQRSFLWVLSREPQIGAERYDTLIAQLKGSAFPVEQLVKTPQR
jgi:apolipoprotein D and lipocalin family protein